MKKELLIAVALLALSALPASAQGPYVGGSLGLFIPHESDISVPGLGSADVEYDLGFGFTLNGGYNFDDFRLEGEFGYKASDVDKISGPGGSVSVSDVELTVLSFMVNGYYDVKMNSPFKPYFGVGIGLINGELDGGGSTGDDTVFGYQITAGVSYPINKNLNLDFYYRFQGAASDFEDAGDELSYTSSNLNAGVRYNF